MQKNVQEMLRQHSELNEKIQKLKDEITLKKGKISSNDFELLIAQYHIMESYSFILAARIESESPELKDSKE